MSDCSASCSRREEPFEKTHRLAGGPLCRARKVAESARCVLPIVLIVVLLCLAAAPMKPDLLLSFLIGGVMLVVGMACSRSARSSP